MMMELSHKHQTSGTLLFPILAPEASEVKDQVKLVFDQLCQNASAAKGIASAPKKYINTNVDPSSTLYNPVADYTASQEG